MASVKPTVKTAAALTAEHDTYLPLSAAGSWNGGSGRHILTPVKETESSKSDRRNAAAIEACVGIPTEALERIAQLPVPQRPAALAEAAARQAKKQR